MVHSKSLTNIMTHKNNRTYSKEAWDQLKSQAYSFCKNGELKHGEEVEPLTKEKVEKMLGYPVKDFSIDPIFDDNKQILSFNLIVEPIKSEESIIIQRIKSNED